MKISLSMPVIEISPSGFIEELNDKQKNKEFAFVVIKSCKKVGDFYHRQSHLSRDIFRVEDGLITFFLHLRKIKYLLLNLEGYQAKGIYCSNGKLPRNLIVNEMIRRTDTLISDDTFTPEGKKFWDFVLKQSKKENKIILGVNTKTNSFFTLDDTDSLWGNSEDYKNILFVVTNKLDMSSVSSEPLNNFPIESFLVKDFKASKTFPFL